MDINQAASIMEVSTNINKEDLKIKFKRLVMKYHPDRNKSKDATKKFIEIKEAYETLIKYKPNPQLITEQWGNGNISFAVTTGNNSFIINMTGY